MPKNTIDAMIEEWASELGDSTRVSTEVGQGELAGFKPDGGPTPLGAARAIAEALKTDSGRRKKYTVWAAVAREVLGMGRLSQKRFDEVLEAGYQARLFKLDSESLSYPILVLCEPEPTAAVEELVAEEVEGEAESERWGEKRRRSWMTSPPEPIVRPEGWNPMSWLPCGHSDCQEVETEGGRITRRITEPGPESCPACAAGKRGNPRYQEGPWRQPVPERDQRTEQRSASGYLGWPGLCTDPATGLYIGGLGNDCRYYHDGPERCTHHQRFLKRSSDRKEGENNKN